MGARTAPPFGTRLSACRTRSAMDAQLAREITLGLPHRTDRPAAQAACDRFVREQFQRKGMVADVNIHAPGGKCDDRNHHAHILLTMREIGPGRIRPQGPGVEQPGAA